jgi:hypothetical protein
MFTKNQIALQTFLKNGLVKGTSTIIFAGSIANRPNASTKQLFHVDKLVNEILNEKPKEVVKPSFDDSKIFTLFENAQKSLKYPKINLKTTGGRSLRLNTSRNHPNTVFLGSGGFGTDSYGKIVKGEGIRWYSKDSFTQADVLQMVEAFANDPEQVAADYGKLNHSCCYCSKPLDTVESLAVGYGPVCAKIWHKGWGKSQPRTKPNVKELVEMPATSTAGAALDREMNELLTDF